MENFDEKPKPRNILAAINIECRWPAVKGLGGV
jgi:hypothetical protein